MKQESSLLITKPSEVIFAVFKQPSFGVSHGAIRDVNSKTKPLPVICFSSSGCVKFKHPKQILTPIGYENHPRHFYMEVPFPGRKSGHVLRNCRDPKVYYLVVCYMRLFVISEIVKIVFHCNFLWWFPRLKTLFLSWTKCLVEWIWRQIFRGGGTRWVTSQITATKETRNEWG